MSASTHKMLSIVAVLVAVAVTMVAATPLDDYVSRPDASYGWNATDKNFTSLGYTAYFFNLSSQTWLTAADTDHPVWRHTMIFVIPESLNRSCTDAFIWFTWGDNGRAWKPDAQNDLDLAVVSTMAIKSNCPAIAVYEIPNEPIFFAAAGKKLSEDDAIGFTFHQFLYKNASAEWLMLFPMVKSAVRAMDAAQEIAPTYFGINIDTFIISGASKRGWTTWLTGAVEAHGKKRVKAMVPVVLDLLGMEDFLHRQFKSYNGYSFALQPYWINGLTAALGLPQLKVLTQLIDPINYASRLTVPKLTVNAVGDEFQLLDDQRHWGHSMPGEMNFLLVKNADHLLITNFGEVLDSVSAFTQSVTKDASRPSYTWSIGADGQITVTTSVAPKKVDLVFTTIKTKSRDFRDAVLKTDPCLEKVLGGCLRFILWTTTNTMIVSNSSTTFTTNVPAPPQGWTGFFLEVTFDAPAPGLSDLLFTSPASVLPLGYPYPDCSGAGSCQGVLV